MGTIAFVTRMDQLWYVVFSVVWLRVFNFFVVKQNQVKS